MEFHLGKFAESLPGGIAGTLANSFDRNRLCAERTGMNDDPAVEERRTFLKKLALLAAGMALVPSQLRAEEKSTGTVPRRKLGRHDLTVSTMALGGHALRLASDEEAQRMVDTALDIGVDFFDNAWDYHEGKSEELMGRCLKGKRDRAFLMTKVCTHDKGGRKEALAMLEQSLQRLGTDHLDLWQVHALSTQEQVTRAFGPGGVMEAVEEARKQGKVRFVGFTGHTDPEVHLAMLSHGFAFDTCQMPVSAIEANSNAFVRRVLPEVLKQKIAPLAMKTLGGNGKPVRDKVFSVQEGLGYALTHPIATIISGVTSVKELEENAAVVSSFRALSAEELVALEKRCQTATESNEYQPYRKWMSYRDGDAIMENYV